MRYQNSQPDYGVLTPHPEDRLHRSLTKGLLISKFMYMKLIILTCSQSLRIRSLRYIAAQYQDGLNRHPFRPSL